MTVHLLCGQMFSLVLELAQRLSILTLNFSCPTLCRSCSLQYNIEGNKRETGGGRLAEEIMLGLQRGFWFVYPVLFVENGEPSCGWCCSSGRDTPFGWAGARDVSQEKP